MLKLISERKPNVCFPTRTGGIDTKLWDECKRIARKAGLDENKFTPKNFRSTFATNRLRSGYKLPELRDQMGHWDMHSIEHYLAAMRGEELVNSGGLKRKAAKIGGCFWCCGKLTNITYYPNICCQARVCVADRLHILRQLLGCQNR